MSVVRGLAAGAAGAAAYSAYRDADLTGGGKGLAAGLFEAFQRKGAAQMAELSRMHRQVDDLQTALLSALRDRGQPTVIVHGGGRASGATVAGVVIAVGGGAALYLRFVKGYRLSDLMYVTRGALGSLQEAVNGSIQSMRAQVEAATADLVSRLGRVDERQGEMLERQGEMDETLKDVSDRVGAVQEGVASLQHQVAYGNAAVAALCGALSEVARRVGLSGGRYVRALDSVVHGAPPPPALLPPSGPQPPLLDGPSAPMLLAAVDDVALIDAAVNGVATPPGVGSPTSAPRPNPAVFALDAVAPQAAAQRQRQQQRQPPWMGADASVTAAAVGGSTFPRKHL